MKRSLLVLVGCVLLAGVAAADDKGEPPQPPPTPVFARVADGKLVLEQVVTVLAYRQETRTQSVVANGKVVPVTYVVTVPFTQTQRQALDSTDVEVYDPDGKKVDADKLPEVLKKETPGRLTADRKLRLLDGIKIRIHPPEPDKDKP
jgi:hypothetical protein